MDEQMFWGRRREGVSLIVELESVKQWFLGKAGPAQALNPGVGSQHSALSWAPVSPLAPSPPAGPQAGVICVLPALRDSESFDPSP